MTQNACPCLAYILLRGFFFNVQVCHPALFIEEILRIIFSYRYNQRFYFLPGDHPLADLVSLARTCRAFKEPALDVLWMDLYDLSRLVRCLPSACRVKDMGGGKHMYVLKRELDSAEVDTVKAYARRVRLLTVVSTNTSRVDLDPDTLAHLCRASQTEPLFPSLRLLSLTVVDHVAALSHLVAVPNLKKVTLFISTSAPSSCEGFMRSLSSNSLAIQDMMIRLNGDWSLAAFSDIMNRHIRHWTRLRSMDCPDMSMDIDTFFHLSRTPSLTRLSFTLGSPLIDQIETANHVFAFPALKSMTLNIISMDPDSKFLTHLQLPALESIIMCYIDTFPSKDTIRSFAMALHSACNHVLVTNIALDGTASWSPWRTEPTTLVFDDIVPFAAFNLTQMQIELDWIVDLKDADLLLLASSCPRIEYLSINHEFGWRSAGVSPVCLMEVLRRCPSLRTFCIALDTHESQSLTSGGPVDPLPSGPFWAVHVADSIIEEESVAPLAAFFAKYMPLDAVFFISGWDSTLAGRHRDDWQVYRERWNDVDKMVKEILLERSDRPQVESL